MAKTGVSGVRWSLLHWSSFSERGQVHDPSDPRLALDEARCQVRVLALDPSEVVLFSCEVASVDDVVERPDGTTAQVARAARTDLGESSRMVLALTDRRLVLVAHDELEGHARAGSADLLVHEPELAWDHLLVAGDPPPPGRTHVEVGLDELSFMLQRRIRYVTVGVQLDDVEHHRSAPLPQPGLLGVSVRAAVHEADAAKLHWLVAAIPDPEDFAAMEEALTGALSERPGRRSAPQAGAGEG